MNDEHRDLLISTVVGGEAGDWGWQELERLAHDDPTVWRDLAEAQRDQIALERVTATAGVVAEGVDVPGSTDHWTAATRRRSVARRQPEPHRPAVPAWSNWRAGAGWAVAALILLTWAAGIRAPSAPLAFRSPDPIARSSPDR